MGELDPLRGSAALARRSAPDPLDDMSQRDFDDVDGGDTLSLRDEQGRIALTVLKRGDQATPSADDLQMRASVSSDGVFGHFAGVTESIFVSSSDLRGFLVALATLDEERDGGAELTSQSPGDLLFRLSVWHPSRRLVADGSVGALFLVHDKWCRAQVEFCVELDPSTLGQIRQWFNRYRHVV